MERRESLQGWRFLIFLSITAVSGACDLQRVSACMSRANFTDVVRICLSLSKVKTCITPFKTECDGSQTFMTLTSPLSSIEPLCGSKGCSLPKMEGCFDILRDDKHPFPSTNELGHLSMSKLVEICPSALTKEPAFASCIQPFKEPCGKVKIKYILDRIHNTQWWMGLLTAICNIDTITEIKTYQTKCTRRTSLMAQVGQCLSGISEPINDNTVFNRVAGFEECINMTLTTCGDEAPLYAINVIKTHAIQMIMRNNDEIPNCTAGAGHHYARLDLVTLVASLVLLLPLK